MSVSLECIGCRKNKQFSRTENLPVCYDCEILEITRFNELHNIDDKPEELKKKSKVGEDICRLCGYQGPAIDHHHIYGRKISDEIIIVCANCHREVHAGMRVLA